MLAVITVDAYAFFGYLRPDLSPSGYRNRCFLAAVCHLAIRRPNLESPSASENNQVVLVSCHAWTCVPTAISGGEDISEVPRYHLLREMSSQ